MAKKALARLLAIAPRTSRLLDPGRCRLGRPELRRARCGGGSPKRRALTASHELRRRARERLDVVRGMAEHTLTPSTLRRSSRHANKEYAKHGRVMRRRCPPQPALRPSSGDPSSPLQDDLLAHESDPLRAIITAHNTSPNAQEAGLRRRVARAGPLATRSPTGHDIEGRTLSSWPWPCASTPRHAVSAMRGITHWRRISVRLAWYGKCWPSRRRRRAEPVPRRSDRSMRRKWRPLNAVKSRRSVGPVGSHGCGAGSTASAITALGLARAKLGPGAGLRRGAAAGRRCVT